MRDEDEGGGEGGGGRRSCESRAARSSVRNTTSANNGYIAWAERLLLANDGNFFRGYVYRRLMTGFFVARNADFLLLVVALLMTPAIFRLRSRQPNDRRKNSTKRRRHADRSIERVAIEARALSRTRDRSERTIDSKRENLARR